MECKFTLLFLHYELGPNRGLCKRQTIIFIRGGGYGGGWGKVVRWRLRLHSQEFGKKTCWYTQFEVE